MLKYHINWRFLDAVTLYISCIAAFFLIQGVAAMAEDNSQSNSFDAPEISPITAPNNGTKDIGEQEATTTPGQATQLLGFPIASHSHGSEGVPFPEVSSIVWDPDPPSARESSLPSGSATPLPTETPYERPRRCEGNKTIRIEIYADIAEKKEPPFYDVLYAPEDLVPLDSAEVYGTKVKVFAYGPGSDDSVYRRMRTHNVPCLPYRYRMSNRAIYEDFGHNALKNYDKDPKGPGAFDPWVTKKLFGSRR